MHLIDQSNGQENIAYRHDTEADTPWHGLGQRLQPGQPLEVWAAAAGLSHSVSRAAVEYVATDSCHQMWADRQVLYRSDTARPLGIVAPGYKIVQPADVLKFFEELSQDNNFTLETAGSLDGGKRIWALAKVHDGATVVNQDLVKPYVLLATSYDGTMATTARFTTVRVVCQNTLSAADRQGGEAIRIAHSQDFDASKVRVDLGIVHNAFEVFMHNAKLLASKQVNATFATAFLKQLLPAPVKTFISASGQRVVTPQPIEDSRAYKAIMALFDGEALGHGLQESTGTAWGLLNACTQYVDWQRGRNPSTRMSSAWFGTGNALKSQALSQLVEVCS